MDMCMCKIQLVTIAMVICLLILITVQTPALINTGRPVGVSTKQDQSEQANLVASTITKESGFSESYICNAASTSVLRKV